MNYLIVYDVISSDSFIRESFDVSNYSNLVIGKRRYIDLLIEKIDIFKESEIIYTDKKLLTLKNLYSFFHDSISEISGLDGNDKIIYFDISNYAFDFESLNNIVKKIEYSDSIVAFSKLNDEKIEQFLEVYHIPIKVLLENQELSSYINHHEDRITIDVSNFFIDLKKPQDVIELFASNFQIRHFNQLKSKENYFIKSSPSKEKIYAEYKFLSTLPDILKPYYPHVGTYEEENKTSSYEIEKIYYFDVSKMFIGHLFSDKKVVHDFLNRISQYLKQCPKRTVSKKEYQDKTKEIFIEKTKNRINELEKIEIINKFNQVCAFNGYDSIESFGELMISEMGKVIDKLNDKDLVFSHGDLCFSNILYNKKLNIIKLIDPKGFKEDIEETFIPIYYDIAKLSHSFLGLYDLILYDYFEAVFTEDVNIELKYVFDENIIENMADQFKAFLNEQGYKYSDIRLFESSLFLSMMPLHRDSNQRMIAQLIQSMDSFNDYKRSS